MRSFKVLVIGFVLGLSCAQAQVFMPSPELTGLAPLKAVAFDTGVNWTLGLPFIRTSPDHGTAYDIAGQGRANPSSMIAAMRLAKQLARRPA